MAEVKTLEVKTSADPKGASSSSSSSRELDDPFSDALDHEEPLLQEGDNADRPYPPPPEDKQAYEWWNDAVSSFWKHNEVDFSHDARVWATLEAPIRHFIGLILAFFSTFDSIVAANLATHFQSVIKNPVVNLFFGQQISTEGVHAVTYGLQIDCILGSGPDAKGEKTKLFESVKLVPSVKALNVWAKKWLNDKKAALATRIMVWALVEGVLFVGKFAGIYWLKHKFINMPGLAWANQKISEDETSHCGYAVFIYNRYIKRRLKQEHVEKLVREMMALEEDFIRESLRTELVGMKSESMIQYVRYWADLVISKMGYKPIYNVQNPFQWMDMMSLMRKGNFHDLRLAEYGAPKTEEMQNTSAAYDTAPEHADF